MENKGRILLRLHSPTYTTLILLLLNYANRRYQEIYHVLFCYDEMNNSEIYIKSEFRTWLMKRSMCMEIDWRGKGGGSEPKNWKGKICTHSSLFCLIYFPDRPQRIFLCPSGPTQTLHIVIHNISNRLVRFLDLPLWPFKLFTSPVSLVIIWNPQVR